MQTNDALTTTRGAQDGASNQPLRAALTNNAPDGASNQPPSVALTNTALDGESNQPPPAALTNNAGARDILIFRGAEYWPTPEDVIREVHAQGLSVRIPRNNIPSGLVKGLSRIALGHIKAVMVIEKGSEDDLRREFEALLDPTRETSDANLVVKVAEVLARPYEHAPSRWLEMPDSDAKREIFERLSVSFKPGIFAYTYFTGTTYYLKPDETETPADLAAKGVHAVRGVNAATGEVLEPNSTSTPADDDESDEG